MLAVINAAMRIPKCLIIAAAAVLAVMSVATYAYAFPGAPACLLVGSVDLHRLPDGSLTDAKAEDDRARYVQLASDARARIEAMFGTPQARPIVVYFNDPHGLGPFKLNSYGSAHFIGTRACVMVGPNGQNVDVVAHELMHAEIHHRVGYWRRFWSVPAWFDEGLAMQVDFRTRYALGPEDLSRAGYVREFETFRAFFNGDEPTQVRNYAAAKAVVSAWIAEVGAASLYARLGRLRAGEPLSAALSK
ncbi:MAG TPA: hypothetical protein VGD36_06315 [Xanthobacteraceae bacterium]